MREGEDGGPHRRRLRGRVHEQFEAGSGHPVHEEWEHLRGLIFPGEVAREGEDNVPRLDGGGRDLDGELKAMMVAGDLLMIKNFN